LLHGLLAPPTFSTRVRPRAPHRLIAMTSCPTTRIEHDLIGDRELPNSVYYGVHTLRALENFPITGTPISVYPDLIRALASIKKAAALANTTWACSTRTARPSAPPATSCWPASCTTSSWSMSSRAAPAPPPT
jgi:hypothetical protein